MRTRSLIGFALIAGFILVLFSSFLPPSAADFRSLYAAGVIVRTDPGKLYDRQLQSDIEARLSKKYFVPYPYPPPVALIFAPLSILDLKSAYTVWLVINIMLLAFCLWFMTYRLGLSPSGAETLTAFVLGFFPVYVALVQGQMSVIILLLFALFFFDDGKRAGIWAGLLTIKPVLAFVPFLILLLNRKWRGMMLALAIAFGHVFLSVELVGLHGIRQNLALLKDMADNPAWVPRMQNLRQFAWFAGVGEPGYLALAIVAVFAFSAACLIGRGSTDWTKIAAIILTLLVSPHLLVHDLTMLLIAVSLAVRIIGPRLCLWKQVALVLCGFCSFVAVYPYPIVSGFLLAVFALAIVLSVAGKGQEPAATRSDEVEPVSNPSSHSPAATR